MQEAEGGILLIGAYMRILQPEGTPAPRVLSSYQYLSSCSPFASVMMCCLPPLLLTGRSMHAGGSKAGTGEAEARLLTFCRRFVANAAEDAWASHQAAVSTGASDIHTWDEVRL